MIPHIDIQGNIAQPGATQINNVIPPRMFVSVPDKCGPLILMNAHSVQHHQRH